MNIAYLSNSTIPSRNANSVHVMKMCNSFAKNGNNVTLYTKTDNEESFSFDDYGVRNTFNICRFGLYPIKKINNLIYALKVKNHLSKTLCPDLFYGRNILCLIFATSFNKPIIYEAHSIPITYGRQVLESYLFKNKNFKRLVVISQALMEEYLRIFPFLRTDMIIVAHDGADIPLLNNEKVHCLDGDKKKIKIGYVGHLYPGRGIDIIINLAKSLNNYEYHLIGGTEHDLKYWKEKAKKIKNIFFYGYIPNGKLYKYYAEMDILVAPYEKKVSVSGGKGDTSKWMSPLKIFEYMSYRKPMIVSDIPVLREVLTNKENCLLADSEDICTWEEAVELLVNNQKLCNYISNQAYEEFINKYTWDKRAEIVLQRLE